MMEGWQGEQHKTNHKTTRQKEELRNRDREPEKKESWRAKRIAMHTERRGAEF